MSTALTKDTNHKNQISQKREIWAPSPARDTGPQILKIKGTPAQRDHETRGVNIVEIGDNMAGLGTKIIIFFIINCK